MVDTIVDIIVDTIVEAIVEVSSEIPLNKSSKMPSKTQSGIPQRIERGQRCRRRHPHPVGDATEDTVQDTTGDVVVNAV